MRILTLLLLTLCTAAARPMRVRTATWDAFPGAVSYQVVCDGKLAAETSGTTARIEVPYTACQVTVVAVDAAGHPSAPSEPFRVPPVTAELAIKIEFADSYPTPATRWSQSFTPLSHFARAAITMP